MEAIERAWRRRYAPWARIFAWWRIGLVLTVRDLETVFAHVEDLRAIGLPLVLEIDRKHDASDVCTFDEAFTRLAWLRKEQTVENASWGPGLGEEKHHFRDVVVWRVADRAKLFARRGIEAEWHTLELRGDWVYGLGGASGPELVGYAAIHKAPPMTFEEAIAAPSGRFQVWGDEVKDGTRVLMIYSLGSDGAKQLTWRKVPEEERSAVVADLSTRGIAVAESDFFCDFVWISNADGVRVYDSKGKVLDAVGDRATLEDGRVIPRAEIACVIAFAADDYVYRGVKAALRSGKEVPLVTEASGSAMGDPTYTRNELLWETGWAPTLASAIATWAGAEYKDLI